MGESIRISVDISLVAVLDEIEKDIAALVKRKYRLDEITIYGNLASKALAAYWKKQKHTISIHKSKKNPKGLRKGILEIT